MKYLTIAALLFAIPAQAQVIADTHVGASRTSDWSTGYSAEVPTVQACMNLAQNRTRAFRTDSVTLCSSKTGELLTIYRCDAEQESWSPGSNIIPKCKNFDR